MATANDIIDSGRSTRLRPAGGVAPKQTQQPAGPFDVPPQSSKSTVGDALVTGLLVIYPTFAAVAAIIAGLFLTSAGSL
ncbi:MAG: hypothetical protein E5X68_18130 [Mesorhizobium sp.]|uniref:hypothetical protein n=1 Tax=Mesorhizobium sp. TaxID=1871066 RepID=UPI000FE3C87E|nr:hypothetical protein [Mesorhizobium sp.]RWH73376.1 MAG: hypothetical protein EOQ84_07070 [Mesorhizobium sp.]RWL25595.1 MAG: hypothetical protein EOR58_19290 [Mesorhizobium sp.]RWL36442.1 MAG: hypothetical protein EOR63_00345 [Mesorhizobium sp.]RWL40798.1 MAG: hypothetical protein EOR59_04940 [Mesorhizobium sp.]RWL47377.1 MAG: hypothetical protein EOR62_28225 [Mesorhizobium sp.]